MYRCQICQKVVPAGVKAHHVVVATRPRHYPARKEVNRVVRQRRIEYTDDPGGDGYEIVREVLACPECASI